MKYRIRNAVTDDLSTVLFLNESVVPHVNSLDMNDMLDFLAKAVYFRVACDERDQVVAFLIGLNPDTDYVSPNFRWFCQNIKDFAYIDRIAVAPSAQRQGVAEALYNDLASSSQTWAKRLACEVNLRPENPGSLAFHHRIGFTQAGTLEIHSGTKKVALLTREF